MRGATDHPSPQRVRDAAYPLVGSAEDYDPLLAAIGDARLVLLGESSHGSHEFSRERAFITRRLVVEKGFSAVALALDSCDANRAARHVSGGGSSADAEGALSSFTAFPRWLACSRELATLVGWLRDHNDGRREKVGLHGLDAYGLHDAAATLLTLLDRSDPAAGARARERWAALDLVHEEEASAIGLTPAAESALVATLADRCSRRLADLRHETHGEPEGNLWAELSPRLVRGAEEHYATLLKGRAAATAARGRHLAATLEALAADLERRGRSPKVVVWAHNALVGDSRATERADVPSLGRLVRERRGEDAVLVGFTTYRGALLTAEGWDAPAGVRELSPALPESHEALFHEVGLPRFLLLRGAAELYGPRLQRSIGVVYRPDMERLAHYFKAELADQFDAVIHLDETSALVPLGSSSRAGATTREVSAYPETPS